MSDSEKMAAEFGTVAGWSADAAQDLGPDYHIPAGCRGSGGPPAMQWLFERMPLPAGSTLLDVGAGIGGPAAFAREHRKAMVVPIEPEAEACRAARSLYGFESVCGSATELPFGSAAFATAWCLGVLCTIPDHARVLRELARVVEPGGRVGMLVYARTRPLDDEPDGNHFPELAGLDRLYSAAGFDLLDRAMLGDVGPTPQEWRDREQAVADWVRDHHGDDEAWRQSMAQESTITELLDSGAVVGQLSALRRRPRGPAARNEA